MTERTSFSSNAYWRARYDAGGNSGAGSTGPLARFKAAFVNGFIQANAIESLIDLGCGDASQLALLEPAADYVGVDVSPTALARCAERHPRGRFISPKALSAIRPAEMALSLDVLYHLTEDAIYTAMLQTVFSWATRFVVIYASNVEANWPAAHVRHRRFTDDVAATQPSWRLLAHLPNPNPYDPARPDDTSFADFFVYGKPAAPCMISVPPP